MKILKLFGIFTLSWGELRLIFKHLSLHASMKMRLFSTDGGDLECLIPSVKNLLFLPSGSESGNKELLIQILFGFLFLRKAKRIFFPTVAGQNPAPPRMKILSHYLSRWHRISSINSIYHLKLGPETSLFLNERSKRQMASFPPWTEIPMELERPPGSQTPSTQVCKKSSTPCEAQKKISSKNWPCWWSSQRKLPGSSNNIHQITVSKL